MRPWYQSRYVLTAGDIGFSKGERFLSSITGVELLDDLTLVVASCGVGITYPELYELKLDVRYFSCEVGRTATGGLVTRDV